MSRLSRFLPKFLRGDKHQQADVGDKSVCRVILLDETEFKLPYKVRTEREQKFTEHFFKTPGAGQGSV